MRRYGGGMLYAALPLHMQRASGQWGTKFFYITDEHWFHVCFGVFLSTGFGYKHHFLVCMLSSFPSVLLITVKFELI